MTTIGGSASTPGADDAGAARAFLLLRTAFTVAPIVFGLDKFFDVLTEWDRYLAPWLDELLPGTAHQAMLAVGVVEVLAGILVAVRPRLGGAVVALWLAGIIVNLVSMGEYLDLALRDLGLLAGALALTLLAGPARRRGGPAPAGAAAPVARPAGADDTAGEGASR